MAIFGENTAIALVALIGALIYSGQVCVLIQKINEVLHWKHGCNPIYSVGNVTLHSVTWERKKYAIRFLLEDQKIPYIEKKFSNETWSQVKQEGINSGIYPFGKVPTIITRSGKVVAQSKVILHYIGRSVGLDCDCKELERCDMIAYEIEELRNTIYDTDYQTQNIQNYTSWFQKELNIFEKLAPRNNVDFTGLYFSSGRLTWIDYLVFEMLESYCSFLDSITKEYKERNMELKSVNCTETFELHPKLDAFYKYFRQRKNLKMYIESEHKSESS